MEEEKWQEKGEKKKREGKGEQKKIKKRRNLIFKDFELNSVH